VRLLLTASEAVPYCKTGGLADVAGALADALAERGNAVRLVLPLYRGIRDRFPGVRFTGRTVFVPVGDEHERVEIWEEVNNSGVRVLFVRADAYFDRPGLYGDSASSGYADNDRRYALLSRAAFEVARGTDFRPDVIHAHDWQTGLTAAYLRHAYRFDPFFKKTASVYTIHNMAYQGNFPAHALATANLPATAFHPGGVEFYGQVSYMKAALMYAHAINTVSPTYAREVMTDAFYGCGMDGILRDRADRFRGILNGIDPNAWDPEEDRLLAARFGVRTLAKRLACKTDLQTLCGFHKNKNTPLLGFIGRLDQQKGVDHMIEIMPGLLASGAQFVSLGQGQEHYVRALFGLKERYPSQVHIETRFSEPFAHKIYGGVDLFLMPSRFEPCGLGQIIAMRYGAVPVVTPTGGLIDTVHPMGHKNANGFVASDHTAGSYLEAVIKAMSMLKDPKRRLELQRNGMGADHSWSKSVGEYQSLYAAAVRWASERP